MNARATLAAFTLNLDCAQEVAAGTADEDAVLVSNQIKVKPASGTMHFSSCKPKRRLK